MLMGPSLSNKVNLGGSSAYDNPGSRDFNTPNQPAPSGAHAPRAPLVLVTRDLLDKPTGEVTNTMDKVSFGTLLTDGPGGGDLNAGLWWTGVDCAVRPCAHGAQPQPRHRRNARVSFAVSSAKQSTSRLPPFASSPAIPAQHACRLAWPRWRAPLRTPNEIPAFLGS